MPVINQVRLAVYRRTVFAADPNPNVTPPTMTNGGPFVIPTTYDPHPVDLVLAMGNAGGSSASCQVWVNDPTLPTGQQWVNVSGALTVTEGQAPVRVTLSAYYEVFVQVTAVTGTAPVLTGFAMSH